MGAHYRHATRTIWICNRCAIESWLNGVRGHPGPNGRERLRHANANINILVDGANGRLNHSRNIWLLTGAGDTLCRWGMKRNRASKSPLPGLATAELLATTSKMLHCQTRGRSTTHHSSWWPGHHGRLTHTASAALPHCWSSSSSRLRVAVALADGAAAGCRCLAVYAADKKHETRRGMIHCFNDGVFTQDTTTTTTTPNYVVLPTIGGRAECMYCIVVSVPAALLASEINLARWSCIGNHLPNMCREFNFTRSKEQKNDLSFICGLVA